MSRYYSVSVDCIGNITEDKLREVMVEKFGWSEEADTWTQENIINFTGKGSLYGGLGEEEAHEQIVTALKEIDPNIKVETTWTYLEDLPTTTYGGLE